MILNLKKTILDFFGAIGILILFAIVLAPLFAIVFLFSKIEKRPKPETESESDEPLYKVKKKDDIDDDLLKSMR